MNASKKEKLNEMKERLNRSINEYPEAWTVIGISAGIMLLNACRRHKKVKKNRNSYILVQTTPSNLYITNHTGRKITYDILADTADLHSYALHV